MDIGEKMDTDNSKSERKKTGPKGPNKPMDDDDFDRLIGMIRIQCTRDEICGVFNMSDTTLNRRIKERGIEGVDNFEALYKKYQDEGKTSLRRSQWKAAQEGNTTMLVWLGKQVLGQKDKQELSGPDGGAISMNIQRVIVDPDSQA